MMKIIHRNPVYICFQISMFVVILHSTIWAQRMSFGLCPSIEPMEDIYLRRYMGVWYQYSSMRPLWKILKKCVKYKYTDIFDKKGAFYVESSYKTIRKNKPKIYFGIAWPEDYHGLPQEAGFNVQYFNWLRNATGFTTQLYVLKTDYDSYAVEYSCTEVTNLHIQRVQVLVRNITHVDSKIILQKAIDALKAEEIDFLFKHLKITNQRNCF